jgi:Spy/CpxP family protein refolding chaperone
MRHTVSKFATVAALAAGMAFAQAPAAPAQPGTATAPHPARRAVRARMMRELGLTDAQKQQAKSIFQQARQSAQPVAQQMRANREALAAAVKANDTAQIQGLSARQGNLHGQLIEIRTGAMARFYATLTPEQKAKADAFRQKVRTHMQQQMEKPKAANNG